MRKLVVKHKNGKKMIVNIPSWDDPVVTKATGFDTSNMSSSGSGVFPN